MGGTEQMVHRERNVTFPVRTPSKKGEVRIDGTSLVLKLTGRGDLPAFWNRLCLSQLAP